MPTPLSTQERYDKNEALAQKRRFGLEAPEDAVEYQTPLNQEEDTPVKSTATYRSKTKDRAAKLDRIMTDAEEIQTKLDERREKEREQVETDTGTDTGSGDTGTGTGYENFEEFQQQQQQEYERERNQLFSDYEEMEKSIDREYRNTVRQIKSTFNNRLKLMKDTNDRVLRAQNVNNLRSGTSRYAAEMAAGLMTEEEQKGHLRMMQIESEMTSLITQAAKARQEGDLEAFNAYYDNIEDAFDRMNTAITEQFDRATTRNNQLRERQQDLRAQEKQNFEQMLDTSSRAAPALASRISGLTAEQQAAVIEEYANTAGIPVDMVLGDVVSAAQENREADLDARNIESQILKRQSDAQVSRQREARLSTAAAEEKEEAETSYLSYTENILNELTSWNDVENALIDDPETLSKVRTELNQFGIFDEEPPAWFIDDENQNTGQTLTPEEIKRRWKSYREKIGGVV